MTSTIKRRANLIQRPRLLRSDVSRGLKGADRSATIDRKGGDYSAGLIRGVSIVTKGEALGHGVWLDDVFVQQVAAAINAAAAGVKSRFTHPGLSSDGLGKSLGRAKGASVEGSQAFADVHLFETAHKAPDGDLAGYVMDLATEDPKAFGTSIVFMHDLDAEHEFMTAHGGEYDSDEREWAGFESPDPANVNHYPHARLKELRAADVVDSPAANPDGLFHRGEEIFEEASAVVAYAIGISDRAPECSAFGVHPERVKSFLTRFIRENGLCLQRKQEAKPSPAQPTKPINERAECKRYLEAFGPEGPRWLCEGKSFADCQAIIAGRLREENEELAHRLRQCGGTYTPPTASEIEKAAGERAATSRLEKLRESLGSDALARFAAGIKFAPKPTIHHERANS